MIEDRTEPHKDEKIGKLLEITVARPYSFKHMLALAHTRLKSFMRFIPLSLGCGRNNSKK